jgi:hypothetical protein
VWSEHAELVALGIGEHDPTHVGTQPDVGAARAQRDDSLDLGITVVRVEVDVQPVFDGLVLGHGDEAQDRIAVLVRADDHLVIGFIQDLLVENRRPELGDRSQIVCLDDEL